MDGNEQGARGVERGEAGYSHLHRGAAYLQGFSLHALIGGERVDEQVYRPAADEVEQIGRSFMYLHHWLCGDALTIQESGRPGSRMDRVAQCGEVLEDANSLRFVMLRY